ncbi:MAG: hypothetical protein A2V93_02585 [Ignavibacteria bacterium RBG_16_34_14]|nr:MAG: hypothetical protein A2V93_02585 [Ignavibacteria bacterium RBG_16_34_14]
MLNRKNLFKGVTFLFLAIFLFAGTVNAQSGSIKYVYTIDYPMGGKAAYLDWVKSIISTLQKPDELISLASYDNYFNETPERVVEFEFANNLDAAKYFDNPEIRNVVGQVVDHGITRGVFILNKRGDYNPGEKGRSNIKHVFTLDYGVGNKSAYMEMVKTVVKTLQTPKEVKRITSYDNYLNSSPNRVIEFEFDSMEDCIKYFEMPEIKSIVDNSVSMSVNHRVSALKLLKEYNKN